MALTQAQREYQNEWARTHRDSKNISQRKWRAENKETVGTYHVKNYYANREKILFMRAKARAKQSGLAFNIELSDVVIPEYCPALGLKLSTEPSGRKWGSNNSPSIDRIDPKQGYIKGNIQVISWRANTLKKDGTAEELRMISDFMLRGER